MMMLEVGVGGAGCGVARAAEAVVAGSPAMEMRCVCVDADKAGAGASSTASASERQATEGWRSVSVSLAAESRHSNTVVRTVRGGGGGFGKNWARGFASREAEELLFETLRAVQAQAETMDRLPGLHVSHSLCGGCGSGLGALLLRELRDLFPRTPIVTTSLLPCFPYDPQLAAYNAVLGLQSAHEFADALLLTSNTELCRRGAFLGLSPNQSHDGGPGPGATPSAATAAMMTTAGRDAPYYLDFDVLNAMLSSDYMAVWSPVRQTMTYAEPPAVDTSATVEAAGELNSADVDDNDGNNDDARTVSSAASSATPRERRPRKRSVLVAVPPDPVQVLRTLTVTVAHEDATGCATHDDTNTWWRQEAGSDQARVCKLWAVCSTATTSARVGAISRCTYSRRRARKSAASATGAAARPEERRKSRRSQYAQSSSSSGVAATFGGDSGSAVSPSSSLSSSGMGEDAVPLSAREQWERINQTAIRRLAVHTGTLGGGGAGDRSSGGEGERDVTPGVWLRGAFVARGVQCGPEDTGNADNGHAALVADHEYRRVSNFGAEMAQQLHASLSTRGGPPAHVADGFAFASMGASLPPPGSSTGPAFSVQQQQQQQQQRSMTVLVNCPSRARLIQPVLRQATSLLEAGAFLHWFSKYDVGATDIHDAIADVADVCRNYDAHCRPLYSR